MSSNVVFFTLIGSLTVCVAVGVLFFWHVYLLCTGQTTIEWYENWAVRRMKQAPSTWTQYGGPFDKGFRNNVKDAFGDGIGACMPWWMVLLLPIKRNVNCTTSMSMSAPWTNAPKTSVSTVTSMRGNAANAESVT